MGFLTEKEIAELEQAATKERAASLAYANAIAPVIHRFVKDALAPLVARVEQLETATAGGRATGKHVPAYRPGAAYQRGALVSHGGAIWCAGQDLAAPPGAVAAWIRCYGQDGAS